MILISMQRNVIFELNRKNQQHSFKTLTHFEVILSFFLQNKLEYYLIKFLTIVKHYNT